jgi:hypothetical protein
MLAPDEQGTYLPFGVLKRSVLPRLSQKPSRRDYISALSGSFEVNFVSLYAAVVNDFRDCPQVLTR